MMIVCVWGGDTCTMYMYDTHVYNTLMYMYMSIPSSFLTSIFREAKMLSEGSYRASFERRLASGSHSCLCVWG